MANRRSFLIPVIFLAMTAKANGQPLDSAVAREALTQAQALCRADHGQLWGRDLCGPIMIVDPDSRAVVANEADSQGLFTGQGGMFRGELPPGVGVSNTAVAWQQRRWIMLRWPLPADSTDRAIMLMHESWHRVQTDLGLVGREVAEAHLATAEGRIALRLELRALGVAIECGGREGRRALRDALAFRAWRYAHFPAAAGEEAALELSEGLAEYTGWAMSGAASDRFRLARHIRAGDRPTSLVRSFAYYTGPAYGVLLDRLAPAWKTHLSPRASLTSELRSRPVSDATFVRLGGRYGLPSLRVEELEAARVQAGVRAGWRARLVDGSTVTLPLLGANIVFNPSAVLPLDELGVVHPRLQANGVWGTLHVTDGALLKSDWSALMLTASELVVDGREARTASWHLQLAPGWSLQRSGGANWRVVPPAASGRNAR